MNKTMMMLIAPMLFAFLITAVFGLRESTTAQGVASVPSVQPRDPISRSMPPQKERDQAARTVQQLDAALAALNGDSYRRRTGTGRKISAAGRARIAAAQRARWAKARGNSGQKQNVVSMPKKKTMSAAARRKIAAAQRARWAKVKAAQKKTA